MFTFFDDLAHKQDIRMDFARRHGRGYMMRSEKRTPYQNGASGARRPVRRKKRAGFFYVLLSLLLSLILWPIGMIMLWRRKVRWSVSAKLLTSIITLFLCVTMLGYGLTVQTEDPTITKVQDAINDFIDNGAVYIADGYTAVCDGAVKVANSAHEVGTAASRVALMHLADTLDQGVELTDDIRSSVTDLLNHQDEPIEPTTTTAPSDEPTDAPTDAPTATPTAKASPTATQTVPASTESGEMPLNVPKITPDPASAKPIGNGTLTQSGEFTKATAAPTEKPTEAPTDEPTDKPTDAPTDAPTDKPTDKPTSTPIDKPTDEPTDAPTAAPTKEPTAAPTATVEPDPSLQPAPASEAVVYFTSNGKGYHMASTCISMSNAKPHTLQEAVDRNLAACRTCKPPVADFLTEEAPVVWTDEESTFHLSAECESFAGKYSLATLENALADGFTPCAACRADAFMAACNVTGPTAEPTATVTEEPTEAPTATPEPEPTATLEPTATPEPITVTPGRALKPAGEITVYHTSNGSWYHTADTCKGMSGGKPYTLSECVTGAKVYKRCRTCNAPLPEYVDQPCLWMDAESLCHTTDECIAAAEGAWSLILRDEALEAGHTGCTVCYANEYLLPNTVVNYPEYVAPSASPTPEATLAP